MAKTKTVIGNGRVNYDSQNPLEGVGSKVSKNIIGGNINTSAKKISTLKPAIKAVKASPAKSPKQALKADTSTATTTRSTKQKDQGVKQTSKPAAKTQESSTQSKPKQVEKTEAKPSELKQDIEEMLDSRPQDTLEASNQLNQIHESELQKPKTSYKLPEPKNKLKSEKKPAFEVVEEEEYNTSIEANGSKSNFSRGGLIRGALVLFSLSCIAVATFFLVSTFY